MSPRLLRFLPIFHRHFFSKNFWLITILYLEILQQIKKADKKICVIMLSSQSQYGKALQTIIKGALEYVVKDDAAFKKIDRILEGL